MITQILEKIVSVLMFGSSLCPHCMIKHAILANFHGELNRSWSDLGAHERFAEPICNKQRLLGDILRSLRYQVGLDTGRDY